MHNPTSFTPDPVLDLVLVRQTQVPAELVWKAWTTPELMKQWFTPKPWKTVDCEIQLWPGGRFWTVMESPEGEQFPGESCVLEVVENRRLVWTSALLPHFRPRIGPASEKECDTFAFTAFIEIEPTDKGSKYTATVVHADEEARKKHEEMGFQDGWGAAFDQLVELMSR